MQRFVPEALRVVLFNKQETVSLALGHVIDWLDRQGHSEDLKGSAELVLAEAINNVIEHAYRDTDLGVIELVFEPSEHGFACTMRDNGYEIPGGVAPEGRLPDVDVDRQELPEGGYGWHLIHLLTQDLAYARTGDTNELRFSMRSADDD